MAGRHFRARLGIADSKSIRNASTAQEKGYDAGKKVSGVKVHAVVDVMGNPLVLGVTTADVTDRDGAVKAMEADTDELERLQKLLVDGGYTGEKFAGAVQGLLGDVAVEVVKRSELHTFAVIPKRWIVERTFGWLDRYRRLWKNCERLLNTTSQMVTLAFISVLIRKF